jgi:hypothetical protein
MNGWVEVEEFFEILHAIIIRYQMRSSVLIACPFSPAAVFPSTGTLTPPSPAALSM